MLCFAFSKPHCKILLDYLKNDTSLLKCFCLLNGIEETKYPRLNKEEL